MRLRLSKGITATDRKKPVCTGKNKNIIVSDCSPDFSAIYAGLGLLYVVTQAITQQNQFHIMNCKINSKGDIFDVARLLATFSDDDPPII